MERDMLGVTLQDRMRNEEICRIKRITDVARRVEYIARFSSDDHESVDTAWTDPPTRWTVDIVKVKGGRLLRAAQDRSSWRALEEILCLAVGDQQLKRRKRRIF
ncbi:uncharacterized protein [Battus philenor]|uniref:uncharacterized protein n=1 Tax=Battus philenor TaxID=42288 RepID=UPI0035CFAE21